MHTVLLFHLFKSFYSIKYSLIKILLLLLLCESGCCVCVTPHAVVNIWRSEGNSMEVILLFHLYLGFGIVLYLLSHLARPKVVLYSTKALEIKLEACWIKTFLYFVYLLICSLPCFIVVVIFLFCFCSSFCMLSGDINWK